MVLNSAVFQAPQTFDSVHIGQFPSKMLEHPNFASVTTRWKNVSPKRLAPKPKWANPT